MSFLSPLRKAVGMNEQKDVAVVCELIGLVLRLAAWIFCVSESHRQASWGGVFEAGAVGRALMRSKPRVTD